MKPTAPFFVLLFLLFRAAIPGMAQPPSIAFQQLNTRNGLPSNKISALYQDRKGFMWIGTLDGLLHYDGEDFQQIPGPVNGTEMQPTGKVIAIFEDSSGNIWSASEFNGFQRYDPRTKLSTRFDHRRLPAGQSDIDLDRTCMGLALPDGQILLGSRAGLFRPTAEDSLEKLWPLMDRESEAYMPVVNCMARDKEGLVWLGTRYGLHVFPPPGREAANLPIPPHIPDKVESMLYEADRDLLWAGNLDGRIFRYDFKTGVLSEIPIQNDPELLLLNFPTGFSRDAKGVLWVGTYMNGLHWFDPKENAFVPYRAHPAEEVGMVDRQVKALLSDRQGCMWIGTDQGIYKFDPWRQGFQSWPLAVGEEPLPSGDVQFLFRCRDGACFIGSYRDGLLEVTPDKELRKVPVPRPSRNWYPLSFAEDAAGDLWLGSHAGLHRYWRSGPKKGKLEEITAFRPYLFKQIFDLQFDPQGRLWVASPSPSMFVLDPKDMSVESHALPYEDSFRGGCRFETLELANDSTMWVGTVECGLWTFDLRRDEFVQEHIRGKDFLEERRLSQVAWVTPMGKGCCFALESRGFGYLEEVGREPVFYTTAHGLPSNRVVGFVPDGEEMWVFTGNGLARWNPQGGEIRTYGPGYGLWDGSFGGLPVRDQGNGNVLAYTDKRLIEFHPDSIRRPPSPPLPKLIGIDLFGRSLPVDSFKKGTVLHVPYHSNAFSIRFASLDYLQPEAIRYAYRLEGLHAEWVNNGRNRAVRFNKLPGGDYTLHVRSHSANGPWNVGTALLKVHVSTPFWKTWWFALLLVAVALAIAYAIYRIRIDRILAIVDIRSRISRNLHDEIGSSLTSISILSQVLLVKQGDSDPESVDLLQKISAHVSQTMSSMDDIIWTINPQNDQAGQLLVRLRQIAADLLEPADIDLLLEFDEELKGVTFNVDQRWNITMVFKEALNNAVKYADCESVEVRFFKQDRKFCLSIADDGKGFETEQPSTRNGLSNMRERARALKGQLEIHSKIGEGTRITMHFAK